MENKTSSEKCKKDKIYPFMKYPGANPFTFILLKNSIFNKKQREKFERKGKTDNEMATKCRKKIDIFIVDTEEMKISCYSIDKIGSYHKGAPYFFSSI